jgi:hypothetical protein
VPDVVYGELVDEVLSNMDAHSQTLLSKFTGPPVLASDVAFEHLNQLLQRNAVPLAWTSKGFASRGDLIIASSVEAPAKEVLKDERLADVAGPYYQSIAAVTQGAATDAVRLAHASVEAMLVHCVDVLAPRRENKNRTVDVMFKALVEVGALRTENREIIAAASAVRNKTLAGHGGGRTPDLPEAKACCAAAAVAIVFLADLIDLPGAAEQPATATAKSVHLSSRE